MRAPRPLSFVLTLLLTTPIAGVAQPAVPQDAAAKGAMLLAQARTALGGEDRVAGIKGIEASGTFRRVTGDTSTDGDFEIQIARPDKYRRHDESGTAGGPITERTQVLNGTDTWEESSGGDIGFGRFRGRFGRRGGDTAAEPPAIDPARLEDIQRRARQAELDRLTLAWLMTTSDPVTWIGTAQSPDGNADVLEVKPAGGTATRVFLDEKSHLPLMLTWQRGGMGQGGRPGGFGRGGRGGGATAPQQAGEAAAPAAASGRGGADGRGAGASAGPVTLEMHLGDYKTTDGVKLPHLISRGSNGQPSEVLTVERYRLNPDFETDTFKK